MCVWFTYSMDSVIKFMGTWKVRNHQSSSLSSPSDLPMLSLRLFKAEDKALARSIPPPFVPVFVED